MFGWIPRFMHSRDVGEPLLMSERLLRMSLGFQLRVQLVLKSFFMLGGDGS